MKLLFLTSMIMMSLFGAANAIAFDYKTENDFPPLSAFESVEDFEKNIRQYEEECLANTGGGTGGVPCFSEYEIWDRELNVYYKRLYAKLDTEGKKALKQSQLAWLKNRDLTIDFNSRVLDQYYQNVQGTMYLLMRAGDATGTIAPIIKQRALLLRQWLLSVENPMSDI